MSLGARIKTIRKNLDDSQVAFANRLGYANSQNVSLWESDKSIPPADILAQIAELGAVSLDWLITGKDRTYTPRTLQPENAPNELDQKIFKGVPVVGIFTGGDPALIYREDNILHYTYVPLDNVTNLFALRVEGDSMVHTDRPEKSIYSGDYVIIDTSLAPLSGDIVAVTLVNGRQMVKQLILNPAQEIELRSYNPIHPPIYINKADISAMYRVVYIQPQLKRT